MGLAAKLVRPSAEAHINAVAPPARAAADIFAISAREDFLLELGAVLADAAALHPVPSLAAALERIGASRRGHILALDTRGMVGLRNIVGHAYARAPHAVILLFAHAADVERLRGAFSESRVLATLPLPMQAARTARVCAEALRVARASEEARTNTSSGPQALPMPPHADRWGVGASLAVLVLAGAAFMAQQTPSAPPSAAPARAAIGVHRPARRDARMEQLLAKARTAMAGKRYTEPAADSALLYYRTALAADPGDPEASQGLARLAALLLERFDTQLRASQLEAAQATLLAFRSAAPSDTRGASLAARLQAARSASARADPPASGPSASADAP